MSRKSVWQGIACAVLSVMVFLPGTLPVQGASLFDRPARKATPLVPASLHVAPQEGGTDSGSLFTGRQGSSLFAPIAPKHQPTPRLKGGTRSYMMPLTLPQVVSLRSLIASVEAGPAQYDAVVFSARIKPPKRPTQMTLQEIFDWIEETPGQNHAIGRYQFIPSTLRSVMKDVGAPMAARFTPALQDRLADVLLDQAGLAAFMHGEMEQASFMNNLARIWAGLPNASGKSHYAGVSGNKAGMSWARFTREMGRIFPDVRMAES